MEEEDVVVPEAEQREIALSGDALIKNKRAETMEKIHIWDERINAIYELLQKELVPTTKRKHLHTYEDAIKETILKVESAVNEEEAISLAQSLLHKGLLVPVKNKKKHKEVFKPKRLYWFASEGQVPTNVLVAESGDIALVADESVFESVLKGHNDPGASLLGAVQATVVDSIVREAVFVSHYYTDDGTTVNLDELVWTNKRERPTAEKLELTDVNVLHKGDFSKIAEDGKRYLICVDGTYSSRKAYEKTLEKVRPDKDFVFLLAVRERHMPDHLSMQAKDNDGRVEWEFNLWLNVRYVMAPLRRELLDKGIDFMILGPRSEDARKKIVEIAKQYKVHVISIGKHKKNERGELSTTQRFFRSTARYVRTHRPTQSELWVF